MVDFFNKKTLLDKYELERIDDYYFFLSTNIRCHRCHKIYETRENIKDSLVDCCCCFLLCFLLSLSFVFFYSIINFLSFSFLFSICCFFLPSSQANTISNILRDVCRITNETSKKDGEREEKKKWESKPYCVHSLYAKRHIL